MISAVLWIVSAVSVAPFAQVTNAQPAERDVVVAEIPRAKVELRFQLNPESELFDYFQNAWKDRLPEYWGVRFVPKRVGHKDCRLRIVSGGLRKEWGDLPYVRPRIIWPSWRLEGQEVIVDVGKVGVGEWWLNLSTEKFGQSMPQLVTIKEGTTNQFDVDLSTLLEPEIWQVLLPEMPESAVMGPFGFEQIAQAPMLQGGGVGKQDGFGKSILLIDPRAHSLILHQLFYSDYEELLNGGYFWTIPLEDLRRKAKLSQSELVIDLSQSKPRLSATLPAFEGHVGACSVGVQPLEDEDGGLPLFPRDYFGLIVSNLEVKVFGLEPGRYRLVRYISDGTGVVQEEVVEVKPPQD